ncbi:MAG: FG-GAP repeat protein, partial [Acidobacteriota bacterium]
MEDAAAEYPLTVDPVFTQQAKLTASDGGPDQFGWSVALSGDTALVGALSDNVGANTGQGSAYVFTKRPTPGDFDSNGKPDIVWLNETSRQAAVWSRLVPADHIAAFEQQMSRRLIERLQLDLRA